MIKQQPLCGLGPRKVLFTFVVLGASCVSCAPEGSGSSGTPETGRALAPTPEQLAERASLEDPQRVVELVLTWDTAGLQFEPGYSDARGALLCYSPQENCTGPEPAADRAAVIVGYQVGRLPDRGDTALVVVNSARLGWIDGTIGVFDSAMAGSDTVRLRRIHGAWRIVRSQLGLKLSPEAALRLHASTAEDSMQLLKAARLRGAGAADGFDRTTPQRDTN